MGNVLTLPSTSPAGVTPVGSEAAPAAPLPKPQPTTIQLPVAESNAATIAALNSKTQSLPEIPTVDPKEVPPPISAPTPPAPVIEAIPLPTIEEMEDELNKSGLLLPDLKVMGAFGTQLPAQSPLAALQPGFAAPEQQFFTPPAATPNVSRISVPTSVGQNSAVVTSPTPLYSVGSVEVGEPWRFPIELVVMGILGIQTAIGITQGAFFGLFQYKTLADQMIAGNYLAGDLQTAAFKAFAVIGLAALSIIFIALIGFYKHDKRIVTFMAGSLALIVVNVVVQNMLAPPELIPGNPLTLFQAWRNR